MIVNSLLHFFLNVLGAKRQEDRNDSVCVGGGGGGGGRGGTTRRPKRLCVCGGGGRNDKGRNVFGATRLGVVWFLGEKT